MYVAGTGIISSIGNNITECINALENSNAGIGEMQYLHSIHKKTIPVAEIKKSNEALAQISGLPSTTTRTALLGMIAAKEALQNSHIDDFNDMRTGFVSANSVGGMDKTEDFFALFSANRNAGRLHDVINHECGKRYKNLLPINSALNILLQQ